MSTIRITNREKCKKIKSIIENVYGIKNIGLRSRKRPYPEIKKVYSKLCKTYTNASLCVIGEVLGGYDHATISHSINTFDDLYDYNGLDYIDLFLEAEEKVKEQNNLLKVTKINVRELKKLLKQLPNEMLINVNDYDSVVKHKSFALTYLDNNNKQF